MKTVLPYADLVIEGYVDPPWLRYVAASPLGEPKPREGFFSDHTDYYTWPKPYPVFHVVVQLPGSGLSLMPEVLETAVTVEQMADLIALLLLPKKSGAAQLA